MHIQLFINGAFRTELLIYVQVIYFKVIMIATKVYEKASISVHFQG